LLSLFFTSVAFQVSLFVYYEAFVYCWFSVATVGAGQKVYGCALPPGHESEDSQVLQYF